MRRGVAAQAARDSEILLSGGDVLTMAPGSALLRQHDVLVRGGMVQAIAPRVDRPAADRIDVSGRIVMPGLVETHWHMWTTLLRNLADNRAGRGYFDVTGKASAAFRPEDMRLATMLAAAEAIDHGITTVNDWCHNIQSPAHARASLDALAQSGLRARFTCGATRQTPFDRPLNGTDFARLHAAWPRWQADGRLTLGLGWRGVLAAKDGKPVAVPERVWRHDLALARDRGLPISVHANNSAANRGHIRRLAELGVLGGDVQIVHAVNAEADEIAALARTGASVSLAPTSEFTVGFGVPPVAAMRRAGVTLSASVDTTTLTGRADLLRELGLVQGLANAQAGDEFAMTPMDALAMGTRVGAQTLGLGNRVGTLSPGKRADLIVVDPVSWAVAPDPDPAAMLIRSVGARDVALVMVDGRILKRDGRLTALDFTELRAQARTATAEIMRRAG